MQLENLKLRNSGIIPLFEQIIGVMALEKQLWILNEPFVGMEMYEVEILLKLLDLYRKETGATLILETHLPISGDYSDVQIFLRDGRIGAILEQ